MKKDFKTYFILYLISLFFFSLVFLIQKHNVGNDSTISEWIINYSGGFTKRGLVGQLCISIANFFNFSLRDSILIFQILLIALYFILLFYFLKDIKVNKVIILSIYTPIFILYPVAEIEVLARKEVFIFCIFLCYFFFKSSLSRNLYKIFILSLGVLIWEPIIFYFIFFFAVDIIKDKLKKINLKLILNLACYTPALVFAFYVALNPITEGNHEIMVNHLKDNFGETCYMSCDLLKSKSTIYAQFEANFVKYSFEIFLRYFLIFLIGFGPLIILLKNSSFKDPSLFFFKLFKNLLLPNSLILSPVIILFAMGYDWGRWVNISYVFSIIFFFYLYINKIIFLNENFLKNKYLKFLNNKNFFVIVIIVFCFGWNPKTVITGDVASKPGFQIPKKAIKIIYANLSNK